MYTCTVLVGELAVKIANTEKVPICAGDRWVNNNRGSKIYVAPGSKILAEPV